ncbi:hypothetical protein CR513_60411, partial [Mucuna pruriens]
MCDASNLALGAVLSQRAGAGLPVHVIGYASWTMDLTQQNYTTTEKELLFPPEASRLYKEKLQSDAKYYIWDDPYLWRLCSDQVICKCIPDIEINSVLQFCHATPRGGHYGSTRTAKKVLDCGFY